MPDIISPGIKGRGMQLNIHLQLVKKVRSYTSTPLWDIMVW
jgi:hypothetical protein